MTDTDAKAQTYWLPVRLIEKVKQYAKDGDYISESEVVRNILRDFFNQYET
ncbi:MAG: ribbon-helix-helix domain-containing protein [Candidatus Kariarchaeaceae archaeon]|jgi:Arc/MetJ-type ribon-helix-helix transcriptional regulator